MEASAAGLAGAASGDGQAEGQQGSEGASAQGEQAQQQSTGDAAIAQMAETLQGLQSSQEEMRQFLESQGQQQAGAEQSQQQQQEQQPPAADLSFLDENSPNYDPQRAAERLTEVMREQAGVATQAELSKVLAPLQQQVTEMQRAHEADALVAEFPDLGKPEVAEPVIKAAEQYAQLVGTPELASNTAFIRMTYLAGRAAQLSQQQQEGAAGASGVATLEGAGGASPGGAGQGATQTADSIRENWSQGGNVLANL